MTGSFIKSLYRAIYFVIFLYDAIKRFKVVFLTKKSEVLLVFKKYCLYHKKRNKYIRRLHTDRKKKHNIYKFIKFQDKYKII